jgi:hypothetical protein
MQRDEALELARDRVTVDRVVSSLAGATDCEPSRRGGSR